MRVVVTGGAGFIGTHLCRALAVKGYDVRVLDLRAPALPVDRVQYIRGDIKDKNAVDSALENAQAVFHFAADVGVELCEQQLGPTYANNLSGTIQVLESIARLRNKTRIIFSGSAVVYGAMGEENKPLSESLMLPAPISFYGAQKLAAEQAIGLFSRKHRVPAICFRFFNVYGAGQDPKSPYSGVISIFADRISRGEPLYLNDGGIQTRDFISVHDVVDACLKALDLEEALADAGPINLGSGEKTRVSELAEKLAKVSKMKLEVIKREARAGDILHSLAAIDRAKQVLGWQPRVSLEEGLSELFR